MTPKGLRDVDLVARAAALAREVHEGGVRKGTDTSYFDGHLAPVAKLVKESGGTDAQVAAAYLHDAAEDEGGQETLNRIRREFGDDVAQIVEDLSDSLVDTSMAAKEDWAVRKPRYIGHLAQAQPASLEVSLADKVHNVQSLVDDYKVHGEDLWGRFNKPYAEYQLWYYGQLADVFADRLPDHPLTPVLVATVNELTALVREAIPDIDARVEAVVVELNTSAGGGSVWNGDRIRVPDADAPFWGEVDLFALTYNGYDRHGGFDGTASVGKATRAGWYRVGALPDDLSELRCALFFEQRRFRHLEATPRGRDLDYIRALVEAIRHASGGSVPGPSDPYP